MQHIDGVWSERFRVRTYETDPHGTVSVQSLCNYFQEAAGNHALDYGVAVENLLEQGLTWVLSRLHVQIDSYPKRGDIVRVETWPSGLEGLFAMREFLFIREDETEGDVVVGRGASAWPVVDVARRRPIRLPAFVETLRVPDRPRAFAGTFDRLKLPAEAAHEQRFHVRYSDLDANRHVNNVCYAEWAVETVPANTDETYRLATLDLHFRAETTLGETVVAQAQEIGTEDGLVYAHQLVRAADGREVARARTRWCRPAG